MNALRTSTAKHLAALRTHALQLYRSHRLRKATLIVAIVLAVYGLLGFFAAPPILKSQLQTRLTALLDRPVSIGTVHLNPYTLRLQLDKLHIADRDGRTPFVDADQLVLNASWASLFRMAPVLDQLALTHPQLHIARSAPQQFNFTDLIDKFAGGPPKPDSQPARFALSNIAVHDGSIVFDDAVTHAVHRVERLELGIPFLANLPGDTDVFVQPLLAMTVDGSPLRIAGRSKPFAASHESVVDFSLNHLDLPRYLGYVPTTLPVSLPRGQLSGQLELHFAQAKTGPQLRLGGQLQLDDLALASTDNAPLLDLKQARIALDDVQPLLARYHFGAVQVDGLALHYSRLPEGRSNLDALGGGEATKPARDSQPTDLRIASLALQDGRLDYRDSSSGKPVALALEAIHGSLRGLSTLPAPAATLQLAAQLAGGQLETSGQLTLAEHRYSGRLALHGVALSPLLPLAPPLLDASIGKGSLDANGQLQADWGKAFDLGLQRASVAINQLALQQGQRTPLAWKTLRADIARFELASHTAQLDRLALHGLQLETRQLADGSLDLAQLLVTPPARHAPATETSPAWQWRIGQFALDDAVLTLRSTHAAEPVDIKLGHAKLDGLSNQLRQPLKLTLDGDIGRGRFQATGTLRPQPLDVRLAVRASRLDIAPLQALVDVPLNVNVASALLSADGSLGYAQATPARLDWHGDVTLGRVLVQDKLSGDDFLRWNSLAASQLALRLGQGVPKLAVGGLALDDFYARVIVNANGRTNLQDVVANPAAAPVSVTQAQHAAKAPTAPAQAPAPAASAAAPPAAEIQIGQITLSRGHLNYTDNFIKPNYTANITELGGKVGAFGSAGGPPAELNLQGRLNDNAPVTISGNINPLATPAALEIAGKADGVELAHLSPYSGKYTGYPITGGRLTADVSYRLAQGKLSADNHIFIDQLSFGDRIEGPGISHLPVKLAVALLKDANGNIDVNVPVSGSLDDPQFSLGGMVWHAFANLIGRAITSPFRLIGAALGGGHKDLDYIEFAPGSAELDAKAQAKLAQVVNILQQKPALTLQITGRVNPAQDENGLRKVSVDDQVAKAAGAPVASLSAAQYDKYLGKAYKHADFPKPRNFLGLAESQPPEVMRKLLQAHVVVNADTLRQLAQRRAQAVQAWLHGKLDDKRMTLETPKLDAKGIDDQGKATRVELGLR